jgi:putative membrane protein
MPKLFGRIDIYGVIAVFYTTIENTLAPPLGVREALKMVRTLVITVDRDNDLGVKAGIRGSVVGRRQVLTAALRLGIADPEESDTNAILGALHQHDLLAEGAEPNDEVEIAILTGDERVGIKSDRNIAQQLEDVISEFQPDRGILVTDGMEDESVLPILSSRLSIDHVEKIIVRQSKGIEGTYYYIAKAIEDPRWRARLLVPIAVFMMILGLGMILPNGAVLIGSMPLLVGVYLLFKGLGAEDRLERLMRDMRESADAAILSSLLWAVTGVAILLAVVEGYDTYAEFRVDSGGSNILMGLTVLQKSLTWIVLGALAFALSMMVLRWKKGNFSGRSVLIIAFGVVLWTMATAALEVAIRITDGGGYEYDVTTIMNDWGQTLLALFIFWALRTGVRSWESKQDTGRYWGV